MRIMNVAKIIIQMLKEDSKLFNKDLSSILILYR